MRLLRSRNWRHFKIILIASVCMLHFTKTGQLKTDELLSNLGCHIPACSNTECAAPKTWVCHFRVVCESQVFPRAQASSGILVCCFSPVKNVWNEWEAFLHQRECILWKIFERRGWACSMWCGMAGERGQGGAVTAWSRVGLQAKESPQPEAQLMIPCRPQVPWKICKAQTWNFISKRDLAILNLDDLNLCPAFVLPPKPTPVPTALRCRHFDLPGWTVNC